MARLFRSTIRAARGGVNEQLEKATNELLSAPDWPTTMEICDVVNMDPRWEPWNDAEDLAGTTDIAGVLQSDA